MYMECLHVSIWIQTWSVSLCVSMSPCGYGHRVSPCLHVDTTLSFTWVWLHVCLLSLTCIWLHAHILSLTSSHITLLLWSNCILNKTNNKLVDKWTSKWTKGDKSARKQLEKTAILLTSPNSCIITHLTLVLCYSLSISALWQLTIFSSIWLHVHILSLTWIWLHVQILSLTWIWFFLIYPLSKLYGRVKGP